MLQLEKNSCEKPPTFASSYSDLHETGKLWHLSAFLLFKEAKIKIFTHKGCLQIRKWSF